MDKTGGPTSSQATETSPSASAPIADPNADLHSDFYNTGRVGRRNAMPDILGQHCKTTTADLPDQLSALTTSDSSVASTSAKATAEAIAAAVFDNGAAAVASSTSHKSNAGNR